MHPAIVALGKGALGWGMGASGSLGKGERIYVDGRSPLAGQIDVQRDVWIDGWTKRNSTGNCPFWDRRRKTSRGILDQLGYFLEGLRWSPA